MTKFNSLLIAVFFTVGVLILHSGSAIGKNDTKNVKGKVNYSSCRTVVRVIKDLKKGSLFTSGDIKEQFCRTSEIEDDAIEFSKYAIGKRASRDLVKGMQVKPLDIIFPEGDMVSLVYTLKEIPAKSQIKQDDVRLMEFELFRSVKPLKPPGPNSIKSVVGKKARKKIPKEHRILYQDLLP
jgi:sialic acid synthase SpsE